MSHDFVNAYGNVKLAVEGLVAVDTLRDGLNRASSQFKTIDDDDVEKTPMLKAEFRALRARLRRNVDHKRGSVQRSLHAIDSAGMIIFAESLIAFWHKVETNEFATPAPGRSKQTTARMDIRDPGPE